MFYVVTFGQKKSLFCNQIDVNKFLKECQGGSVKTFRSRAEAINFINISDEISSKPILSIDTHVLYVKTTNREMTVEYDCKFVTIDGITHTFNGKTPDGISNNNVAEMMAFRTVLDSDFQGRMYFVTESDELIKAYQNHKMSRPQEIDPVSKMCFETFDMMFSRNVILSKIDPSISS